MFDLLTRAAGNQAGNRALVDRARDAIGMRTMTGQSRHRGFPPARSAALVAALTMATLVALPLPPVFATTEQADAELADAVSSTSLSGSFLAGQVAVKNNDDRAAVAYYERSLALDPENLEIKRLYFLALTSNGRVEEAVAIGRELATQVDDDSFLRLVLAVDSLNRKSWAQTVERLKQRSSGDLDRMVETLLVAWAHFGAGEGSTATQIVTEMKGPDWLSVISNHHLGLMAAANGNDEAAVEYFSNAIANRAAAAVLSETFVRALEGQVRALARLERAEEAERALADGLRLLPNHPPFHHLANQLAEAKPLTPIVTSARQGAAEIFYNIGAALNRQNNQQFAQGYLQLADHLNPQSDAIIMALAGVFESQDRHERANGYYERIALESAYHRRSQLEFALNLNDLERTDDAKSVLRTLIEEDSSDLLGYLTLGGVLSQHEDYREAATVYDAAVRQIDVPEPHHWNLFYRRGIAHERLKEWDKAEPSFQKALELSPNQPDVLNYLGYSWIDMGINLDEGMALIRKAVELRPRSGYIVDSLGWAYYRLGKYEDAVRELERAVELLPEDPVINDHLGDAYWKTGRKLEATFQWRHSLTHEPTEENAAITREKLEKGMVEDASPTASNEQ